MNLRFLRYFAAFGALAWRGGASGRPAYGMVVLSDNPLAFRFEIVVMSEKGQAFLARYGFRPIGVAD